MKFWQWVNNEVFTGSRRWSSGSAISSNIGLQLSDFKYRMQRRVPSFFNRDTWMPPSTEMLKTAKPEDTLCIPVPFEKGLHRLVTRVLDSAVGIPGITPTRPLPVYLLLLYTREEWWNTCTCEWILQPRNDHKIFLFPVPQGMILERKDWLARLLYGLSQRSLILPICGRILSIGIVVLRCKNRGYSLKSLILIFVSVP